MVRVLFEVYVHMKHQIAYLRALQKYKFDPVLLTVFLYHRSSIFPEQLFFLELHLILQQLQKLLQLAFLIFMKLHREDLPHHAARVLRSADAQQILNRLLKVIVHQLILEGFAGIEQGSLGGDVVVARVGWMHLELIDFFLHLIRLWMVL